LTIEFLEKMIKVHMIYSWVMGFLIGLYIVFYPKEISLLEAWADMLFYFGNGLLSQYTLLHFFNKQENGES
jgi:hypothetical protein